MTKLIAILPLIIALSTAQLLLPPINVEVHENFSINDLLGNYNLVGVYNSNQVSKTARCFKILMRIDTNYVVTMTHSYIDTTINFPVSFDVQYISSAAVPTELINRNDALYNWKNTGGQNDLIVRYYGEGKVILEKRDRTMAYVLSRTGVSQNDLTELQAKGTRLGLSSSRFIPVNYNQC